METKIGIITLYYKSLNYGGNLQAWALCHFLNSKGYEAEQIQYSNIATTYREKRRQDDIVEQTGTTGKVKTVLRLIKKDGLKGGVREIRAILTHKKKQKRKEKDIQKTDIQNQKEKAFENFNREIIPHSKEVYDDGTISKCVNDYDVFITGSDQVWNMEWFSPTFFLDFVPSTKIKMSYAASMAMNSLTDTQQEKVKDLLKDYTAVSVRETETIDLIKELSPLSPTCVVDPVLLLEKEDWDEICAERVVNEKYLFCYFLGNNQRERALAKKFAKKHKLRLVHLPFAAGTDCKFGDKRLVDVTPQQFVSLIKHAEYVFTDSFHAVAFSHIYQKQYFIFNRSAKAEMSSRITDITELFNTTERFCVGEERETYKYIHTLDAIDYTYPREAFEKRKQKSIEYLQKSIQKQQSEKGATT